VAERQHQGVDQRAEIVAAILLLDARQHLVALGLDAIVVPDDDLVQESVATAEVVVQRGRVPLPGPLDDPFERDLVDALAREQMLRGREQSFPGVGRVARQGGLNSVGGLNE
jgi:hypothetical protein